MSWKIGRSKTNDNKMKDKSPHFLSSCFQTKTQLGRTLWMFAMIVLQVLLFVGMTFLVQSVWPAKHWGVNEGISYWVFLGSFAILAIVNSVLVEQYQRWWISIIIGIVYCVFAFIFNRGFLSYYPYRSLSFISIAVVSFVFPYILRFFLKKRNNKQKQIE